MEEAYIYSNHSKIHESSVATFNPNKNRFSSPLSWRAQAYKNGNGIGRTHKEEDGVVPTSPSRPPRAQRTLALGGRVSPPGASHQTGGKSSRYRLAMTKCRQAVTNSSACLALGWRSVPLGSSFASPSASC